ncbi:MAG: hypothetical protein KGJ94_10665 [Xanthomonadaceae bacterium]|nr:hypothetical protein [Xanthomonadaceae bacterium]
MRFSVARCSENCRDIVVDTDPVECSEPCLIGVHTVQQWADYLDMLKQGGNVVPIRKTAR